VHSLRQFVAGTWESAAILSHRDAQQSVVISCRIAPQQWDDYEGRGLIVTFVCLMRHD
jgi:hypothetical protein